MRPSKYSTRRPNPTRQVVDPGIQTGPLGTETQIPENLCDYEGSFTPHQAVLYELLEWFRKT